MTAHRFRMVLAATAALTVHSFGPLAAFSQEAAPTAPAQTAAPFIAPETVVARIGGVDVTQGEVMLARRGLIPTTPNCLQSKSGLRPSLHFWISRQLR